MGDVMKQVALWVALTLTAGITAGTGEAQAARCKTMAGKAEGITREFAQYEAMINIRVTTGNWPIQTARIGQPHYRCKGASGWWTCKAVARVCQ